MKPFRFFLAFCFILLVSKIQAQWKTAVLDPTTNFTLSWQVTGTQITFSLHLNQDSWMGIGFHPHGSTETGMINADIYTAEWNTTTNQPIVNDRFSQTSSPPPLDNTLGCVDNVLSGSVSGTQSDGSTTIQFSRLLSTGDTKCDVVISGSQLVIWARGNNKENFGYHYGNRGSLTLQFV